MAVKKKNVSLKMGKHKSRSGGLTAAGRKKYNAATGSNLKAPQPGGGARKRSFCARMSGVKGPMKKPNGKPTRKALALRKWKCQWSRTIIERDMAKKGLYANIHAKRKRIAAGSGEKMRKVGSKGSPTAAAFKKSAKTAKPYKKKSPKKKK